jgi:T5SS/PEP-CTERM-associated repeat protein
MGNVGYDVRRTRSSYLTVALLFSTFLFSEVSHAQYTANFQTNIISGVISNYSGDYYVGYTNYADVLLVENGGALTSSVGAVGNGLDMWSSNNVAVIRGPGSVWDAVGGMWVGVAGPGNSLVISNGGLVVSGDGEVGVNANGSSNNAVVVSDSGSAWKCAGSLLLGQATVYNSLVISNGAQVVDASCEIGVAAPSSSNTVVVTGSGSVWSNEGAVVVGEFGGGNRLLVSNGGSVVATNLTVGLSSFACNNLLELDSGTITVASRGYGGLEVLEVRQGELIVKGGMLQVDTLVITNPCAQFIHTGGTVLVGNLVFETNLFRITSITRQSNDMLVTWMMGPGISNTLQVSTGAADGSYNPNSFADIFVVTNNPTLGAVTNYLDVGAATNGSARYYRARLIP